MIRLQEEGDAVSLFALAPTGGPIPSGNGSLGRATNQVQAQTRSPRTLAVGKCCPDDEQFVRSGRPQYLSTFSAKRQRTILPLRSQRRQRRTSDTLVRKEPKEYHADHQLRAVATFGGKKYAFVLDKQSKTSQGYDRLYFDLNRNGDLTDDAPIDRKTPAAGQLG